ncbi:MAG: MBL fold metallo-hydrolase [Planctomycetota bacterium]|nr:MBL fold metallo-hydrolase [Planctomycetota bacterium]
MKIHFHGAVRTVTGSLHIVETARGEIVLLDCGLFQGRREEARTRNRTLPIDAKRVKAVVLSHAHIDHIGNLPTWAAAGLNCPVFATGATADLCAIMLRDSANIQVIDAQHVNRRLRNGEKPVEPLYLPEHAEAAIALLRSCKYREWFDVVPGLKAIYHDAGHILGSASITLEEHAHGSKKRLAFTGDVGRPHTPILRDPEPFGSGADVLLSECTYGDREHPPVEAMGEELRKVLYRTIARGGKVIVPAFALGRTQAVLYELNLLEERQKLPPVPVYVDSPLACKATEIFQRHPECYDADAREVLKQEGALFAIDGYACITAAEDSKKLNDKKEPCVVIAASGMCEAGRILHHLNHGIGNPRNTIMIVGFQAEHTLGRKLVERWRTVRIFGQEHAVKAEIVVMNGFSGHAGRTELADFLERCRPAGPLFLVHGDEPRAAAFTEFLKPRGYPDVRIPNVGDTYKV